MNNDLMFSSDTEKWDTPDDLIADLATVFNWSTDVCAERANVCDHFYNEETNGLTQMWTGLCWMNPPYGREIGGWMEKARVSKLATTVCLIPARTDTRWWHENVLYANNVVFIKGRLKFGNAKNSAPFPSAFVVFGEINRDQLKKLAAYGWLV
jgi:phage N-6-adenine-methyltransferase